MDSFWKSALEAAEKAKSMAVNVSQKGMELAEATAEEAGKRLKDLGLNESLNAPGAKQKAPTPEELEAYGINQTYIDFIRSLNYSTFREFPAAPEAQPDAAAADAPPSLNAWQVRHAMLIVRVVKEVNELRYVLCPRYLTDQRFWEVYFSLARQHLPDVAFCWSEGDPLPAVTIIKEGDEAFMSLTGIGNQLRTLSTKIQHAATAAAHAGAESAGVELSTFFPPKEGDDGGASGAGVGAERNAQAGSQSASMLEVDHDLEEYLRGAVGSDKEDEEGEEEEIEEGGGKNSSDAAGDGGATSEKNNIEAEEAHEEDDEDLDLDQYLNELSAEVDDGEDAEDAGDDSEGVDVEAVLRELEEEDAAA